MTPDYIYVREYNTVSEVLEIIRNVGKNTETIDVVYVINRHGELLDDLRIREIILAKRAQRMNCAATLMLYIRCCPDHIA